MILITGANGYVGTNLVRAFSSERKNLAFKCLLRSPSKSPSHSLNVIQGDILDKDSLLKAFHNVDTVIHMAAATNPKKIYEFHQVNYIGTMNVVEVAKKAGIKKIIFLSSYDAIMNTDTHYGNSKKKAETLIIQSGIEYVILRPTVIYGGEKDPSFSYIVSLIKKLPLVPVIGNGEQLLQPIYIEDLIKLIELSLEDKYKNCIYSVAGPERLSHRNIIKIIAESLNKKVIITPIPTHFLTPIFKIIPFSDKNKIILDRINLLTSDKVTDIERMKKDFNISLTVFSEGIKSIC